MKRLLNKSKTLGTAACALLLGPSLLAQSIGQWDFEQDSYDAGGLQATAGSNLGDLQLNDGPFGDTAAFLNFGTTTHFGIPKIGGVDAHVLQFPALSDPLGLRVPTPVNGNGGGSGVNSYTLLADVLYPASADALFRPILQTDDGGDGTVAYLAVSGGNGIGPTNNHTLLASGFAGTILPNTWYRIGFVVDLSAGKINSYINGVQAATLGKVGGVDTAYALIQNASARVFSNNDTNTTAGFVNSLQFRDTALNAGQMSALGGPSAGGIPIVIPPVPSFIASRAPDLGSAGAAPQPAIQVVIDQGDTTIVVGSVKLFFDGGLLNPTVTGPDANQITLAATAPQILDPLSVHSLAVVYQDSVAGSKTNTWTFTVANYQNVTLPTSFYLENFEGISEGNLPAGWSVTNATTVEHTGLNLCDPNSDSYLDWVIISSNTFFNCNFENDAFLESPIVLNGALIPSLAQGNFAFAESDNRCNSCDGQLNVMFTGDINCAGRTNVFVAWNSIYKQNQDNLGAVEYSIDHGQTWLPVIYYLDDENRNADVIRTNASGALDPNGTIDIQATFGTVRGDQFKGLAYSNFIGASVTTDLIPYVAGRINDDNDVAPTGLYGSRRIEVVRIPQADGQGAVRFRLVQAGTCSWFFGVDNFGLYEINTPVFTTQPQSQSIDAGTAVTFSAAASSQTAVTYQWQKNGINIAGATGDSYSIASVQVSDAGQYKVIARNASGPAASTPATLTVSTLPVLVAQSYSDIADPGARAEFSVSVRGGRPLTYQWFRNGSLVAGATGPTNVILAAQASDIGDYQAVASNSFGSVTSQVAHLSIFLGSNISNDLVVHLPFDNDLTDVSGRGNSATYAHYGDLSPAAPTFGDGKIGQAFQFTTLKSGSNFSYATLGYPSDLKFGGTNDFSVSLWVNYQNQVDDPAFLSNKDWDSSDNRGWGIFNQGGGNYRVNVTGTGGTKMSSSSTPTLRDGSWHNIVVTFIRGGYVAMYADGALVSKNALLTTGTIDTDDLTWGLNHKRTINGVDLNGPYAVNIGQDGTGLYNDQGGAEIVGASIDDLGIWRRALTPQEAANIFAQGSRGLDLSTASRITGSTPKITGLSLQGTSLQLTIVGGTAPFILEKKTSLSDSTWTVVTTTSDRLVTVPMAGATGFIRVRTN